MRNKRASGDMDRKGILVERQLHAKRQSKTGEKETMDTKRERKRNSRERKYGNMLKDRYASQKIKRKKVKRSGGEREAAAAGDTRTKSSLFHIFADL